MINRLMTNAFWRFRLFDVYAQTVPDSLHCADTGLFQTLLITILTSMRTAMFQKYFEDADKRWKKAMHRLKVRLQQWSGIDSADRISNYLSNVGIKITEASESEEGFHPLFKASDFRQLMLVNS